MPQHIVNRIDLPAKADNSLTAYHNNPNDIFKKGVGGDVIWSLTPALTKRGWSFADPPFVFNPPGLGGNLGGVLLQPQGDSAEFHNTAAVLGTFSYSFYLVNMITGQRANSDPSITNYAELDYKKAKAKLRSKEKKAAKKKSPKRVASKRVAKSAAKRPAKSKVRAKAAPKRKAARKKRSKR